MKKAIALFLALLTLAGCSNIPVDESKPVHFEEGFFSTGYYQNGKLINFESAESAIRKVPAAHQKLQAAATWMWAGFAADAVGLAVALTAPRDANGYYDRTRYWTGLGIIIVGGAASGFMQNTKRIEAADLYNNERFTVSPRKLQTRLYLAPREGGATAGLALNF